MSNIGGNSPTPILQRRRLFFNLVIYKNHEKALKNSEVKWTIARESNRSDQSKQITDGAHSVNISPIVPLLVQSTERQQDRPSSWARAWLSANSSPAYFHEKKDEREPKKKGSMLVQPLVAARYTDLGRVRDLSSGGSLWKPSSVVSVGQVSIEM
jgi:hypothetical protein